MLARMYAKNKRPLPISGCPDDRPPPELTHDITSPRGGQRMTHHGGATLSRSNSSRISRHAKDDAKKKAEAEGKPKKGLKKFFIGPSKDYANNGPSKDVPEEVDYDYAGDYSGDDGSDDEPQILRPRRRFVRSGLTTYEQWISKNAMGRRFKAPNTPMSTGPRPVASSPQMNHPSTPNPATQESSPSQRDGAKLGNMTSLSNALQEVMHARPAVMRSVIDPPAGPQRVRQSYVVEQTSDGDYFVASRRVPDGPVRVTKDDSFIGSDDVHTAEAGATSHAEFEHHHAAARLMRRSERDTSYRNQWVAPSKPKQSTLSVAAVMATGKAELQRRMSNGDRRRRSSVERSNYGTAANTELITRKPSANVKIREPARATQALINQMAHKYVDHVRARSSSRSGDTLPPQLPRSRSNEPQLQPPPLPRSRSNEAQLQPPPLPRSRSNEKQMHPPALPRSRSNEAEAPPLPPPRCEKKGPLRAQAVEVVDTPSPTVAAGILDDHLPTTDKGPMTMDELFDTSPVIHPPKPVKPSKSVFSKGKSSHRKKAPVVKHAPNDEEEEELDNTLMNSFRNLKDVDALKRSRSLEEDEKAKPPPPPPVVEVSESEEEYPDYPDDRTTMDYGSSYEDESTVRNSNIADFLGGFRSRNSMNRNSLAGRHSLGLNTHRKDDFVSRAARSLRNSRKVAQESVKVTSELSRKLREARARVPVDLRGDPPQKKRGFLNKHGKRVRFDMTLYCREFEVIEPEESDDDQEVQRWQQRDSEQDEDEDEDEDELSNPSDYEDDIGVPIPGPVIAAAVAEGTPYFTSSPYSTDSRYSVNSRMSVGRKDDEHVSVVARKSSGKKFEILL